MEAKLLVGVIVGDGWEYERLRGDQGCEVEGKKQGLRLIRKHPQTGEFERYILLPVNSRLFRDWCHLAGSG